MDNVYQWDRPTLLKGERLTQWRREQLAKIERIFERADQITDTDEVANSDIMDWHGKMPAYPEKYVKETWEQDHQYSIGHLIEELHGALEKHASRTTALHTLKLDLEAIEGWEDI